MLSPVRPGSEAPLSRLDGLTERFLFAGDVCAKIVGVGSVSATTPTGPAKFTVEIICTRCDSLYQPCSDCESCSRVSPSDFLGDSALIAASLLYRWRWRWSSYVSIRRVLKT